MAARAPSPAPMQRLLNAPGIRSRPCHRRSFDACLQGELAGAVFVGNAPHPNPMAHALLPRSPPYKRSFGKLWTTCIHYTPTPLHAACMRAA